MIKPEKTKNTAQTENANRMPTVSDRYPIKGDERNPPIAKPVNSSPIALPLSWVEETLETSAVKTGPEKSRTSPMKINRINNP